MALTLPLAVGPYPAMDMIFSCVICQRALSDIYPEDDKTKGLRRLPGSPQKDQITNFWLTECGHLTCGEHFEGGGVPFHPEQEPPSAPCPFCCKNNDALPKKLLFINGTSKGDYDSKIPDSYFDIPPPQCNGPEKGAEGLRFQYLSLIRYSTTMVEKLRRWEARQPEIIRQLDKVRSFREELTSARSQLLALQKNTSSIDAVLAHEVASPVKISNNRRSHAESENASGPVPNSSLTARDVNRPTTLDTKAEERQTSIPPINLTRARTTTEVRNSLESDNREQRRYIGHACKPQDAGCTLDQGSRMSQKRRKMASPASTRLQSTDPSVPGPSRYWELPFPSHRRPPIAQARMSTDCPPSAFQRRKIGDSGATTYSALEPTTSILQAGPRNHALVSPILDNGLEHMKIPRYSHVPYQRPCPRGMTPKDGFSSRATPFRLSNMTQASNRNPLSPNVNFDGYGNRKPEDSELQLSGLDSSYERMRSWSSSRSYQGCSAHGSEFVKQMGSGNRRLHLSSAQTFRNVMSYRGHRPDHDWPPVYLPGPFASPTGYGP